MKVLVTGGAGYIGSHTCVELIESGYEPVVVDNLCNSNPESLNRVREITGKKITFYEGDVRDEALLRKIFRSTRSAVSSTSQVSRPWAKVSKCLGNTTTITSIPPWF